jgi:2-(1,2-epoxy-1,2-dihydrophenyl)acetyl-CoA isomerase
MLAQGPVLLEIRDGIAVLTLNRPESANGMNEELLQGLCNAIMLCHGEPGVRAVVVRGAGKNFCAGGDVHVFASKGEALPDYIRKATALLQNAVTGLLRLQAPVIVSVQGFAAGGGGFGLACAADLVVAAETAKFLPGATRVGMAPDAGTSVTLQKIVGFRKALEILLTNPTLTAAQARDLGIVNRVVPDAELEAATMVLAREIADSAPLAMAAVKRLVWSGMALGIESCLTEEARTVSELSGTADAREGLAAVIERRKPKFIGR